MDLTTVTRVFNSATWKTHEAHALAEAEAERVATHARLAAELAATDDAERVALAAPAVAIGNSVVGLLCLIAPTPNIRTRTDRVREADHVIVRPGQAGAGQACGVGRG